MSSAAARPVPALRGFVAALWCATVILAPAALAWTWAAPADLLKVAAAGTALILFFPPIRVAGADETNRPTATFGDSALRCVFAAALFLPFAAAITGLHPSIFSADSDDRSAPGEERLGTGAVQRVTVELEGPLSGGAIQAEGYQPLRVRADLLPGERQSARAWMVGPKDRLDWPDSVMAEGITAKLVEGGYRCPDWARRAGPTFEGLAESRGLPGLTAVLAAMVAAVGSIAVLRARRLSIAARALGLCILGFVGAIGARQLAGPLGGPPSEQPPGLPVAVLEGRRLADGGTQWVESRRGFGGLSFAAHGDLDGLDRGWGGEFDVADPLGAGSTELALGDVGPGWTVRGRTAAAPVDWRGPFDAGLRLLVPEVNTWGEFDEAWERTPLGSWSPLGPLALGMSPSDRLGEGQGDPPGWCAQGLPQGASLFLGRLSVPLQGTSETWIRLSGFRLP
jgi:hypothetical protein